MAKKRASECWVVVYFTGNIRRIGGVYTDKSVAEERATRYDQGRLAGPFILDDLPATDNAPPRIMEPVA